MKHERNNALDYYELDGEDLEKFAAAPPDFSGMWVQLEDAIQEGTRNLKIISYGNQDELLARMIHICGEPKT